MWDNIKSLFKRKKVSVEPEQTVLEKEEQHYLETNNVEVSDVENLKRELKEALKFKEDSLLNKEKLERNISRLKKQLEQREAELRDLNSKISELSSIASDSKEGLIIDSLKKNLQKQANEIKSKEEEIEELEDEISSIQRKLKSAKTEVAELTQKVESFDNKIKKYETEISGLDSELSELKEEDKIKSKAIEFVNSVLQAKDADDRDAREINEKVSRIESIILDQYIPLQKQYFNFNKMDQWINDVRAIVFHWSNLQRKSWIKRKKVVAFIGEFSAGKTSIVNRILSQDNPDCPRLPVSGKATTAIATYISYGEGFYSQFTDANGNLKNLSKEMFTMVNKDILSYVNVSSIIQYFVMKYKNDNLRGLSILDTPGFSSNDEQDQDRTLDVINEADALFWVLDANSGDINKTSLKIIAENVKDIPLYIVINKADTKSSSEITELKKHIQGTMARAEIEVADYVIFSKKAPLENIMRVIESLPEGRTGLDIWQICHDLKSDILRLQDNLKNYKTNLRKIKKGLDDCEEGINQDITYMTDDCEGITSIPHYNDRWFLKDDYRMDQKGYEDLCYLCYRIKDKSSAVSRGFERYKGLIKDYHTSINEQNDLKEQCVATENIYKLLMSAIKALDANLYREIEDAVSEAIELDKNQSQTEDNDSKP